MARNRVWSFMDVSTTLAHSAAGQIGDMSGVLEADISSNLRNYSHLRTVGSITVSAPAGSSAYDGAKIFLGITVVEEDAAAAGAWPDPYGDNVDWIWTHGAQIFVPDNPSASLATPCIPDHLASPWIDTSATRKIRGSKRLSLVGYDDSGITGTLNISANLRTLWAVNV